MTTAKNALRQHMARLKALHQDTAAIDSEKAMAALETHPAFQVAKTVLLYYSLPDEVNTHGLIERWYRRKRLLLPVVKGTELELRLYRGSNHMATGAFGIAEPEGTPFTDYAAITLAVVPGMAFDVQGNRLGRGKGFYDRLLPQLMQARKIGICFPYQLTDNIPADPSDFRMDDIITG